MVYGNSDRRSTVMNEALPELPSSMTEIFIEYSERPRYVLNYDNLRCYLSGEDKTQPFCVLTDDRLYACTGSVKGKTEIIVSDVDKVDDIKSVHSRKKRKFYFEPFVALISIALGTAILLGGMEVLNTLIGGEYIAAYSGTMFFILGTGLMGFGVYMLAAWRRLLKRCVLSVVEIYYSNGKKQSIPLFEGIGAESATKLRSSLRAAKLAKKSYIPDLFAF